MSANKAPAQDNGSQVDRGMTQTTARSTRQSWRGQPFSLNALLPLITSSVVELYSEHIEPLFFKNKLRQRLHAFGLSDRTLVPVLTLIMGT